MVYRILMSVTAAAMLSLPTGCALVDKGKEVSRQTWKVFKPRPTDYRDPTEEESDEWEFVGKEARGDRPLEKEPDPIKRLIMSPKARNIERNLGID